MKSQNISFNFSPQDPKAATGGRRFVPQIKMFPRFGGMFNDSGGWDVSAETYVPRIWEQSKNRGMDLLSGMVQTIPLLPS